MLWVRSLAVATVAALTLAGCARTPLGASSTGDAATPGLTPIPVPAPITVSGVVETGNDSKPLTLRNMTSTSGTAIAKIPNHSILTIDCVVKGETVSGTQGSTQTWDFVTFDGRTGYVSAAYLQHGVDPTLAPCAVTPTAAQTPLPVPSASGDLNARIVAIARSQVGVAERSGNCSPYGPCEQWGGDFAAWVWAQAGINVPSSPFTGALYTWGTKKGRSHGGLAGVGPGDLVLYGTGPKTTKTSVHVDIVIEVTEDHLRVVGGNVDDRVVERDVPLAGIYGWIDAQLP